MVTPRLAILITIASLLALLPLLVGLLIARHRKPVAEEPKPEATPAMPPLPAHPVAQVNAILMMQGEIARQAREIAILQAERKVTMAVVENARLRRIGVEAGRWGGGH